MLLSESASPLLQLDFNDAALSANNSIVLSVGNSGNGSAAASIGMSGATSQITIHGAVVLEGSLDVEALQLGSIASRLLRYRSTTAVTVFAVPDETVPTMGMFGARVTVVATTANSSMAMAEFHYTRIGSVGMLGNYQEIQRGMGIQVQIKPASCSNDSSSNAVECGNTGSTWIPVGLEVQTTTAAHITVMQMLMF
jgi:hypothetical protein